MVPLRNVIRALDIHRRAEPARGPHVVALGLPRATHMAGLGAPLPRIPGVRGQRAGAFPGSFGVMVELGSWGSWVRAAAVCVGHFGRCERIPMAMVGLSRLLLCRVSGRTGLSTRDAGSRDTPGGTGVWVSGKVSEVSKIRLALASRNPKRWQILAYRGAHRGAGPGTRSSVAFPPSTSRTL